jgi:hypothetical protein
VKFVRVACALAGIAALVQMRDSGPAMAADGFAGHWHVTTYVRCVSTLYNNLACQKISGGAFAAFAKKGVSLTIRSVNDYTVDARGRFQGHGSSVITEKAAHHGPLHDCDPGDIGDTLWTGSCYTAWRGTGHVARGRTGLPDFWLDSGVSSIHGLGPQRAHHLPFHASSDSGIPAVPGVYTTKRYLDFFKLTPVSGLTIRRTVKRTK